jgi:hypothetical protein
VIKILNEGNLSTPINDVVVRSKPKPLKNIFISDNSVSILDIKYCKDLNEARRFNSYEECKQFADNLVLNNNESYKLTQVVF